MNMRLLSCSESAVSKIESLLSTKRKSKLASEILDIISYWKEQQHIQDTAYTTESVTWVGDKIWARS